MANEAGIPSAPMLTMERSVVCQLNSESNGQAERTEAEKTTEQKPNC